MKYYFNEDGAAAISAYIDQYKPSQIVLLTDDHTRNYCLNLFKTSMNVKFTNVNIKPGDTVKNIGTLLQIWKNLMDIGADRKSLLINLGGGVISDIGGFAGATFKRGIKFIHIPTSLLGMVDAAIGGKNGINFLDTKNQIGTIVLPELIWINPEFLNTLPTTEFNSGFAEMLKHGLITDASYWQELIQYYKTPDPNNLSDLIQKSVRIKDAIIQKDPYEYGLRKLLNFGHTLGHGIESYLNYQKNHPITHGKAVAIGMVLEAYLSYKINGLDIQSATEIKETINLIYKPVLFKHQDIEAIIKLMRFDKKNENGKIKFVLLKNIGQANYNLEVPEKYIEEAFDFYQK